MNRIEQQLYKDISDLTKAGSYRHPLFKCIRDYE